MPRYFTLEEAERLLPAIQGNLREAASLKVKYDEAEREMRAAAERIFLLGGVQVDQARMLERRQRRDGLAARLKESVDELHSHGCLVKDLDEGLIDFPTRFRGREVLLCWKLGEARIEYWHGMEEGFRGRKPIDEDFLSHHGSK
jgi:hypothetical protein